MLRQLASFVSSNVIRSRLSVMTKTQIVATSATTIGRCSSKWPIVTTSAATAARPLSMSMSSMVQRQQQHQHDHLLSESTPAIAMEPKTITLQTFDGRTFKVLDSRKLPPLKPHIVKRRLGRMRTYVDAKKSIRHSPWRLNLICQMISGLTVPQAIQQLSFCEKSRAPLVQEFLETTVKKINEKDGLPQTKLEIAECFVTRGTPLKRIRYMGRGRRGQMTRPYSHIRLVLREIDFKLRIFLEPTIRGKKEWLNLQVIAEAEEQKAQEERAELEKYMARQRQIKEEEDKKSG